MPSYDVVLSLMHTHCEKETCMDVLLVGGDASRVQGLYEALRRMRDVHKATLVHALSLGHHKIAKMDVGFVYDQIEGSAARRGRVPSPGKAAVRMTAPRARFP